MAGHSITLEQRTMASPADVWEVLTDIGSAADVLRGVDKVELLTDGPYAVGTRWRETRTMMGKSETQEMQVTEAEPPSRTVITAEAGGVHYTTVFTVTPSGDGSLIRMEFAGEQESPGLVSRVMWTVMGPLGARITKRVMADDLRDIAAAAEADGNQEPAG